MPDFDAIAVAIAARYDAAQVTPPAALGNIRSSTADLPNQMPALPCVLVIPVSGDFNPGNGTRTGNHEFMARFYYSQTNDLAREMAALRKWATVLVDQHKIGVQLGLPATVAFVRTTGWKVGVMSYAGEDYSGIEMTLHVRTSEPWLAVA